MSHLLVRSFQTQSSSSIKFLGTSEEYAALSYLGANDLPLKMIFVPFSISFPRLSCVQINLDSNSISFSNLLFLNHTSLSRITSFFFVPYTPALKRNHLSLLNKPPCAGKSIFLLDL